MKRDAWATLVERSGWGDGKGSVSFNKCVTWTALIAFVYCIVMRYDPAWTTLSFGVVVIGAGFGLKGYLAATKQRTESFSANLHAQTSVTADLTEITKAVLERRDPAKGVEPTP